MLHVTKLNDSIQQAAAWQGNISSTSLEICGPWLSIIMFAGAYHLLLPSARYRIFSNLIRTSFADFLNEKKKKLVRGSNPHLSFNRPLPTRQTDSVMSDDGESD